MLNITSVAHLSMGHRQTEDHQMRGVQSVAFIIGFIYGQSIFFK